MPFPAEVDQVVLSFGRGYFLGSTGTVSATVSVKAVFPGTSAILWEATGDLFLPFGETIAAGAGLTGTFPVPRVDQDGWVDQSGSTYKNWYYLVSIRYQHEQDSLEVVKQVQPTAADMAKGIDLEAVFTGDPAPVQVITQFVRKVNGVGPDNSGNVTIDVSSGDNTPISTTVNVEDIVNATAIGRAFMLATTWTSLRDSLGAYAIPTGGIPKATLSTGVQQSLGKADASAPLDSPKLTGSPTAPTATQGDSSTAIATTAFAAGVAGDAAKAAAAGKADLVNGLVPISQLPSGVGSSGGTTIVRKSETETINYDVLGVRALDTLQQFLKWLDKNNIPRTQGDIGEWGVPSPMDSTAADGVQYDSRYRGINMVILDAITKSGLSVTQWTTSAWVQSMRAYVPAVDGGDLAQVTEVGLTLEKFLDRNPLNGVNMSGHEFGIGPDGMTNGTPVPGRENYDYRWPTAGDLRYIASRGVKRFRLNLGWERIQRVLGGPLDATAVTRMTALADAALATGTVLTLDIHNYGRYTPATGVTALRLGDAIPSTVASANGVTTMNGAFVYVWQQLATLFKTHAGVEGFSLMNEPVNLPAPPPDQYNTSPQGYNQWQQASAAAVYAIQAITGSTKRIRINGYQYASARDWNDANGGSPWLYNDFNGKSNNLAPHIIWEAHFYANGGFDTYADSYQKIVDNAAVDNYKDTTNKFGTASGTVTITTGPPEATPSQTGQAGKFLSTDGTRLQFVQGPVTPLWQTADNAVLSLPRTNMTDSGSAGSTPASGVAHFTLLRADKNLLVKNIKLQIGGTAGNTTTAKVGLYTVVNGVFTLVASSANLVKFGSAYSGVTAPLAAAYQLVAGQVYAVAVLQVGTTPAAILGHSFPPVYLGAAPALGQSLSAQTDLPAAPTNLGQYNFQMYYELTA